MAEKHPTKLVAYTPRLDAALKKLTKWNDSTTLNEKNPSGKRQAIQGSTPVETESTAEAGYNGYFKLVDMTTTDENGVTIYKVGVVDGATYNAEAGTSGDSVVKINGRNTKIPMASFILEDTLQHYLLVEYVWGTNTANLIIRNTLAPSDDSILYLQIGRCFVHDGFLQIEQWAKESGTYSLQNEYTGDFKLYRVPNESSDSGYAVKMKSGYTDVAGQIEDTDITWTGRVYINFRVQDNKIYATVEDSIPTESEKYASWTVGIVGEDLRVTQTLKSDIRLYGKYVV